MPSPARMELSRPRRTGAAQRVDRGWRVSPASPGSPNTHVPGFGRESDESYTPYQIPERRLSPRGLSTSSPREGGVKGRQDDLDGSEQVMQKQKDKLQLFQAWSLWRKDTWENVQNQYSIKLEAMRQRIDSMKSCPSPSFAIQSVDESKISPGLRSFVIHSPKRYKSSDGLLNKLYEAQIFIQQAVAENAALRHCVYLLRSMHHWRLSIEGSYRKRHLLKKVLLRWIKGVLSKAFLIWVNLALKARKHQDLLKQTVLRMCNIVLVRAWEHFMASIHQTLRLKKMARKVLCTFRHRFLSRGWRRWQQSVLELRHMIAVARRALCGWQMRRLAKAWRMWQHRTDRRARLASVATKIILRWQNVQISPYFDMWWMIATQAITLRRTARRIVNRWCRSTIIPAFLRWQDMAQDSKTAQTVARHAIRRLTNQLCARAWGCWSLVSLQRGRVVALSTKTVMRWKLRTLCRALATWTETHVHARKLARLVRRISYRWMGLLIGEVLTSWFRHVQLVQQMICRIQAWEGNLLGLSRRWQKRMQRDMLRAWRHGMHRQMQLKITGVNILRRWTRAVLWRVIVMWSARMGRQIFFYSCGRRIYVSSLQRTLTRGFRSWVHNSIVWRQKSQAEMTRNLSRQVVKARMLEPYFNTWREYLYYEMCLRRIALLVYFRTQTTLLRRVLCQLHCRLRYKACMKVVQGRMNHRIWRLQVRWTSDLMKTGFRLWNKKRGHRCYMKHIELGIKNRRRRITSADVLLTWSSLCQRSSKLAELQLRHFTFGTVSCSSYEPLEAV